MSAVLPPTTDAAMAGRFFRAWYGESSEKFATVSQMAPGSKRMRTAHHHVTPDEAAEMFDTHGMDDLVYAGDLQWNLYMSVGLMDTKPVGKRKGGKRDITSIPGVWVDLDTDKTGFFDDEAECMQFLRNLPKDAWPTIIVATGTGGVHAYWRCEGANLGADEAETLCTMWWTYLSSRTDKKIDKLVNADRLMKLPGSIRWPKNFGDAPSLVRLLYVNEEGGINPQTLRELSSPAWDEYVEDIRVRKERVNQAKIDASRYVGEVLMNDDGGRWNKLMSLASLEDLFNETYSWDDILIPLGWTKLDQDGDGRDIWARPGLSDYELHKSAATDYDGSHVMSLFSDSSETGLAKLLDTGATLTKYRVYVECVWNGNEAAFVEEWMKNG